MDAKKFEEKEIKVAGTTGVEPVATEYIDVEYKLILNSDSKSSPTGWVVVAILEPSDKSLPTFHMRWDHNQNILDVDTNIDDPAEKKLWYKNKSGYSGHHPTLANRENREYEINIKIPNKVVFIGVLKVGLLIGLNISETITVSEAVDIEIV